MPTFDLKLDSTPEFDYNEKKMAENMQSINPFDPNQPPSNEFLNKMLL
jgi:hypothetical protein